MLNHVRRLVDVVPLLLLLLLVLLLTRRLARSSCLSLLIGHKVLELAWVGLMRVVHIVRAHVAVIKRARVVYHRLEETLIP